METSKEQFDNISRSADIEAAGSRESSVCLPHSERPISSAPRALLVTNDVQSDANGINSRGVDVNKHEDEGDDLQLQKAIEEMRRLDEILSLKTVQGQEVKRQRKEIRDKLWQELLQNTPKERAECAHEASNTRSFLALDAPIATEEWNFEPVFETEAPDCDDNRDQPHLRSNRSLGNVESPENEFIEIEQDLVQGSRREASKSKKKHKNFVKRNIELIGEGGQEVLTQPEKERLDELLREMDREEEDWARDAEDDVWAVSVSTGHGYTPEPPDLKHLHDIDSRIRLLLPVEEFASLQTSFSNLSEFQGSESGWRSDRDPLPGEKALKEEKEQRGQERRLQEIQQQLQRLSHGQEDEGPDLTEEQLQNLLEECELSETWSRDTDVKSISPR